MPKFELNDVEDFYTYYVVIIGISEDIFWHADFSFVEEVAENKIALDAWKRYVEQREMERK